jgi:plasmid stability protein
MATITIRNLDDDLKERLRVRAALRGRSMEEEVRSILRQAVGGVSGPKLLELSRATFGPKHGVELELPSRTGDRPAPDFDEPDDQHDP